MEHDGSENTTSTPEHHQPEEEARDEVKEIQHMSRSDNNLVRTWRIVVMTVIFCAAVAVTITTYDLLRRGEQEDFELAFQKFAATVEDSALAQMRNIQDAMGAYVSIVSATVEATNQAWPYVTIPNFEALGAANLRAQSGIELFVVVHRVLPTQKDDFLNYTSARYQQWVNESHSFSSENADEFKPFGFKKLITARGPQGFVEDVDRDEYWPVWQTSPPPYNYVLTNWNLHSVDDLGNLIDAGIKLQDESIFTKVRPYQGLSDGDHAKLHSVLHDEALQHPHSFVNRPIHKVAGDKTSPVVAFASGGMAWDASLRNLLPTGVAGIHAVVANNCNQTFTYELVGHDAFFVGFGDWHEHQYDAMAISIDMSTTQHPDARSTPGHCLYTMTIYPSAKFEALDATDTPSIYAVTVASTFALVIIVFMVYDIFVQRRNKKIVSNAARSNAIVSSLFPTNIRDRLIGGSTLLDQRQSLKSVMSANLAESEGDALQESKPLADLFLETTILFADIVGFTAWSSVREPTQVFTLLETVYAAFDDLARASGVFKVETVGDCYVAATGLPRPRGDHAIAMVRYARQLLLTLKMLLPKLEVMLGPDTSDLDLRIGIHSGSVTAGVLRGERARFQLFGDSMNTTCRIESTGKAGRIHISQETADLLIHGGKESWIERRLDMVNAKGKGEMKTFWIKDRYSKAKSTEDSSQGQVQYEEVLTAAEEGGKIGRLVDWASSMLLALLRQIVARRRAEKLADDTLKHRLRMSRIRTSQNSDPAFMPLQPMEEVKEIITLPAFNAKAARLQTDPKDVELSEEIVAQLDKFVQSIAGMYNENSFHNFQHASHVTMSVVKLLSRIVAPEISEMNFEDADGPETSMELDNKAFASSLHDHTYGITSDPLTQFACAFSALIHDVAHLGVPNSQLSVENPALAERFQNQSVAEQNSLTLAWQLFMEDGYKELRETICESPAETRRFRELIVNSVMATDIADKNLKALRNARWDKAFAAESVVHGTNQEESTEVVNCKATIVIEHLIQASDVSHTMQHWNVYRRWNELFFRECYTAYKNGRADKDPSESWYKGELGFFDFYIIPLAKKLKECGVFGKSSDEYLNYAVQNRKEWETKGQAVVAEMVEAMQMEDSTILESVEENNPSFPNSRCNL